MKNKHGIGLALLASGLLALGACGGSDDPPPVTSEVPASASASTGGFIDYLMALVALTPENLEPVDISAVTPQTSDVDGPTPLP